MSIKTYRSNYSKGQIYYPPRGVPHCGVRYETDNALIKELWSLIEYTPELREYWSKKCPRQILGYKSGEGLEWCIAGHAERNAIINAARHGISVKDTTMYMTCEIPCTPCLIEIINAGITEIVVTKANYYDKMGEWLVNSSGLKLRTYEE